MDDRDDDSPELPGETETDDAGDDEPEPEFEALAEDADDADSQDEAEDDDSSGRLAGLWAAVWSFFQWVGGRLQALATTARYRSSRALLSFLMGSHPNTSRLLATAVVGCGLVAGVGVMAILVRQADTSASSGPVVRTLLTLATSPWLWALAILILFRQLLFFGDRLLARVTASRSGFSYNSIRRLAEEAKRPDLDRCERVLVQSGDSAAQITEWCRDALAGEGHDAPTFTPPGEGDGDDSDGLGLPRQPTPADDPIDTDADDDSDPDFWSQLRLFRLELASAVDLYGVLWRFLVPTALTFVGVMLWLRIWIQPWFIPVVLAVSAFVGGAYYWAVDLRHRRRLAALRHDETPTRWTDLAILTKRVEIPETTMYYGYLDGNVYASEDPDELAGTLAERAIDRLEGRHPAPAIEETNAYLLKRYLPMLEAWETEHERVAIMDQLIDTVADAPEGILPRSVLLEQVVEYDRRYVAWGLLFIGRGRDPDLVREVYQDLLECHALTETPVTVPDPETGETGDERELIAVSKGDESFPPEVVQLRGEFDSLFGKQAFETRYDAPETGDGAASMPYVRPENRELAD